MTTREISGEKARKKKGTGKSSYQITQGRVSQLVALNKLPEEIQDSVHTKSYRI